jgi:ubiquinone/menaquinone biosynthesis C-methylase UbiE
MGRTVYEVDYVEVYDLVMRGRGKDYRAEAAEVAEVVRRFVPDAKSLLDVACGTGLHLRFLADFFDRAEGLDASAGMLVLAKARVPAIELSQGDMRDFDLHAEFDAITCMFAIPHLDSAAELETAIACFARHLAPGGVVVVEPWFAPDEFLPGYVASDSVRDGARAIHRVSHSTRHEDRDDRMRMVVHYVDADPEHGIRHATETVGMTLFTHEQYETAFAKAGCVAQYLPGSRFGRGLERGLWVARRP